MTDARQDQPQAQARGVAGELLDTVREISRRLEATGKYAKRTRHLAWTLAVSVALDLLLSGLFGLLLYGQAATNRAVHNAQLHVCGVERQLWEHVLDISAAPPHETPAARAARLARLRQFRSYVETQLGPRNCAALGAVRSHPAAIWHAGQILGKGDDHDFGPWPAPRHRQGALP